MGALDLLTRSIKAGKYGRPFYSKMDEALEALKREKGTAEEFLRELEKQPGVKKAEIEDRGIRKVLESRSRAPAAKKPITKQQMQKILNEQAPVPPVVEDVLGGKYAQYEKWRTPGGENYREILLKLPEDYLLEPYMADHFGDTPNILAHIRVQDFQSPTKGYAVVNTRSGNKSPVFQTMEEAQAYMAQMPESLQGMLRIDEAAGKPKKVLLVDEVQSDWHQTGRKQGYKTGYEEGKISMLSKEYDALSQRRKDLLKAAEEMPDGGEAFAQLIDEANDITPKLMGLQSQMDDLRTAKSRGVPDAPFKKNWHELAMKRVLDYAAENGYDTVAITPGAEQAKRYDLSQHVSEISIGNLGDQKFIRIKDPSGKTIDTMKVGPDGLVSESDIGAAGKSLDDVIGKDLSQKILSSEKSEVLRGLDLQVGGEGMKGFYDKILPDYLNTYGKQYGAYVGQISLKTPSAEPWNIEDAARFHGMTGAEYLDNPNRSLLEKQFLESRENKTADFHSFDITPQMREVIKTKGQPLYSAMGAEGLAAGSGAATIGADALMGNDEQPVQNPVHFTENPDAMLLELMQRN